MSKIFSLTPFGERRERLNLALGSEHQRIRMDATRAHTRKTWNEGGHYVYDFPGQDLDDGTLFYPCITRGTPRKLNMLGIPWKLNLTDLFTCPTSTHSHPWPDYNPPPEREFSSPTDSQGTLAEIERLLIFQDHVASNDFEEINANILVNGHKVPYQGRTTTTSIPVPVDIILTCTRTYTKAKLYQLKPGTVIPKHLANERRRDELTEMLVDTGQMRYMDFMYPEQWTPRNISRAAEFFAEISLPKYVRKPLRK